MELEQLYLDANLFCKGELSQADFLLYYDMAVSRYLTRYPKKLLMPHGAYVRPQTLEGGAALPDGFYYAILCFIGGIVLGNQAMYEDADRIADEAYTALWKASAHGKRMQGDKW